MTKNDYLLQGLIRANQQKNNNSQFGGQTTQAGGQGSIVGSSVTDEIIKNLTGKSGMGQAQGLVGGAIRELGFPETGAMIQNSPWLSGNASKVGGEILSSLGAKEAGSALASGGSAGFLSKLLAFL